MCAEDPCAQVRATGILANENVGQRDVSFQSQAVNTESTGHPSLYPVAAGEQLWDGRGEDPDRKLLWPEQGSEQKASTARGSSEESRVRGPRTGPGKMDTVQSSQAAGALDSVCLSPAA